MVTLLTTRGLFSHLCFGGARTVGPVGGGGSDEEERVSKWGDAKPQTEFLRGRV